MSRAVKWIAGLAALAAMSGCAALSDNTYHMQAYDPSGREIKTGIHLIAQGAGIYSARNGICSAYPGAEVVFTDTQTHKTLKPYKCGGTWNAKTESASAGANLWEDETWKKPGAGKPEVRKALMECGAPNPRPEIADMTDNQYMLMARCMTNSGFRNVNGDNALFQCRNYPSLPACRSNAVIPARSAERRLGSAWCEAHRSAPECRP